MGKKNLKQKVQDIFEDAKEIGYKVGEELLKIAGSDFKTQGS